MAASDNIHSRLVAWLKILLPLAALAVLSTLFLFSRQYGGDGSLPYAQVDLETMAREPRMSAPRYSGTTTDGATLSVSADVARPDPENPGNISATGLAANLETPDGGHNSITAAEGRIDASSQTLTMTGGVVLRNSSGYEVRADSLKAALDATALETGGAVQATGPLGAISAGRLQLDQSDASGYVLVFRDGVRLVYQPVE